MANEISGPVEELNGELVVTLRKGLDYIGHEHVYNDVEAEHFNRVVAALDQLVADAQRFNGIRMVLCESNRNKQESIFEAIEPVVDAFVEQHREQAPTPELINDLFDRLLLAACEARK
jgi:hypothetical protein